ncbi:MAG: hypothetical protein WDM92_08270 [Caulobacteraceae bacterium]
MGLCKYVLAAEDRAVAAKAAHVLDLDFIAQHTAGFDAFAAKVRATPWEEIERESGLTRQALETAGEVYVKADRVIGVYGMGLTQHVHGFENIAMLVNLLLMRGNIGRQGTGVSPRARPLQRARAKDRRHQREAGTGPAGPPGRAVRLRAAAREGPDHGGRLRGHPRRPSARLHRPRRQLRAGHPRARGDGGGVDRYAPDGADRHQAEPQPPDQRRGSPTFCPAAAGWRRTCRPPDSRRSPSRTA